MENLLDSLLASFADAKKLAENRSEIERYADAIAHGEELPRVVVRGTTIAHGISLYLSRYMGESGVTKGDGRRHAEIALNEAIEKGIANDGKDDAKRMVRVVRQQMLADLLKMNDTVVVSAERDSIAQQRISKVNNSPFARAMLARYGQGLLASPLRQ